MKKRHIKIKIVVILFLIASFITSIAAPIASISFLLASHGHSSIDDMMVGLPPILTSEMVIGAIESEQEYGVPASLTLAQIILESGGDYPGNLSALAYECNNLFGMKGEGPAGSKEYKTLEEKPDGTKVTITAKFRKYHNVKESIDDHGKLISSGHYSAYIENCKTADDWAKAIQKAGYATDSSYAETLIDIMTKYNLYVFNGLTVEEAKEYLKGDGNASGVFRWPLAQAGKITSYFGYRGDIGVSGATADHGAIDIAVPGGTAVYASDGGTVIHADWYGTGGRAIIIKHAEGTETHYYHLREGDGIMVKKGQKVSKGQQIGRVGTTGASSGYHLHFGLKVGGKFVDPLAYVKQPQANN